MNRSEGYHVHISAERSPMRLNLKEVWGYRDLILLFTKRTFKLAYKQTVLGPLWMILSPLFTSVIYTVVFGGIAGLSTAGVPKLLFYLSSHALWAFFADCLNKNAYTFVSNARMFSKVYFPRLAIPVSTMLSSGIQFLIQMGLVSALLVWYAARGEVSPNWAMLPLVLPVILATGVMGLGLGILVSSVTTKYRDLTFLVGFGLHLWMYVSPVIYPASQVQNGMMRMVMTVNPMTTPMELFRMALLGVGEISFISVASTALFSAAVCLLGAAVFNRVERNFIDTV